MDSPLAHELLKFYDDLTAHHACNGFVLQALASAFANNDGVDERTATGAIFCTQWLNDQSVELEQRLKKIQIHARVATKRRKPGQTERTRVHRQPVRSRVSRIIARAGKAKGKT